MIKINRKVEYSLMILKHMSEDGSGEKKVTARDICDKYSIPFDTVSKVLQILAKNGILESNKGINGGYVLIKDLKNINYLYLNEIIEGKKYHSDCKQQNCMLLKDCNITGPISNLNKYLQTFFQSLTLDELLNENMIPATKITESLNNKVQTHELN